MAAKKGKFNLTQLLGGASIQAGETAAVDAVQTQPARPALKVVPIKISDLQPSPDNFYSVGDVADLKAAIEMFGVVQPLAVKPLGGGKYEIISGHRRHRACCELVAEGKPEYEYVPCGIQGERDEIKERVLLIMTNSTARELTDYEKMKQAEELTKHLTALKKRDGLPGRVRDLVAEILNTSSTNIARAKAISNNLVPELAEEFKSGNLGVSAAYELSGLPEDRQREAAEVLREKGGLSISDVKEKKRETPPAAPPTIPPPYKPKEYPKTPPGFEEGQGCEPDAREGRDFADFSRAEKKEAAIALLNARRFAIFQPGADTRIFDFIIEALEDYAPVPL
jgi:ParB family chromosome partitioning protein